MGQDDQKTMNPVMLNIGCGLRKFDGYINVDAYPVCEPDVLWDLNKTPWPFEDCSVDHIYANHIFEHLDCWMDAFKECARILKPAGTLQVNVPDHTSTISMGYIDHQHILSLFSFHMLLERQRRGTNAWAITQGVIPLAMTQYVRVPHEKYVRWWMPKRLLLWCCDHMVNFCFEQRFTFVRKENGNGKQVQGREEEGQKIRAVA